MKKPTKNKQQYVIDEKKLWENAEVHFRKDVLVLIKQIQEVILTNGHQIEKDDLENSIIKGLKRMAFRLSIHDERYHFYLNDEIKRLTDITIPVPGKAAQEILLNAWDKYRHTIKDVLKSVELYLLKLSHNAYKFYSLKKTNIDYDEIVSIAFIGVSKAIPNFDYRKGIKFITYIKKWVLAEINNTIRKEFLFMTKNDFSMNIDFNNISDPDIAPFNSEQNKDYIEAKELDEIINKLKKTYKIPLIKKFGSLKLKQKNIAKQLNISTGAVSQRLKKAYKIIKNEFNKNNKDIELKIDE